MRIEGLQPTLCGQHRAVCQATRQQALRLSPAQVEQCAVHYLTLLSPHPGKGTQAIHRASQGLTQSAGQRIQYTAHTVLSLCVRQ